MKHKYEVLEVCLTDYCNLSCPLCSQATPHIKDKQVLHFDEFLNIGKFIKSHEFRDLKISGGEPTTHPDFSEICKRLKEVIVVKNYAMATNGFKLEQYKDDIGVFDLIELSNYPGFNDEEFTRIKALKIPSVNAVVKRKYAELNDIYQEKNLRKNRVWEHCWYSKIMKIRKGRVYPCCVIYGLAILKGIDINTVSVPLDENWRENLEKINMEPYCRFCWVDVWTNPFKIFVTNKIARVLKLHRCSLKNK